MAKRTEKAGSRTTDERASKPAATESAYRIGDPAAFARNMMRVGEQSQRLLGDFVKRQSAKTGSGEPLDPLNLTGAFSELLRAMSANPAAMVEAQFQLWRDW